MKKLGKILLSAAVMSFAVCLFMGMGVSAKVDSGQIPGLYGENYQWSMDTSSKTLTIQGDGWGYPEDSNAPLPWMSYAGDIKTIVADGDMNLNGLFGFNDTHRYPRLKTLVRKIDDLTTTYDFGSKTAVVEGNGIWPDTNWAWDMNFDKLVIDDGIRGYDGLDFYGYKEYVIGKKFHFDDPNVQLQQGYEKMTVDPENLNYASYENCLYNKNYQRLLASPNNVSSLKLHPDVKVIEENSLPDSLTGTLVLPWGLKEVDRNVFQKMKNRFTVVIPDTVINFDIDRNNSDKVIFMISKGNRLFDTLVKTGTEIWTTDNIKQYYPNGITPALDKESYTDKEYGLTWTYDSKEETLTITGSGGKLTDEARYHFVQNSDLTDYAPRIKTLIVGDGITEVETVVARYFSGVETMVIGKDVKNVLLSLGGIDCKPRKAYQVDAANPYYASYEGLLYSKNFETLLDVPGYAVNISYHPNLRVIGDSAYAYCEMNPVVIPWGVTKLGIRTFRGITYSQIILPDTLSDFGDLSYSVVEDGNKFICSQENQNINTVLNGEYGTVLRSSIKRQDISKYYPKQQNKSGWVQEDGKWYYYQNNAKTTGWQKVGPTWYYMDKNGVMQTGWITSNGTKYLLRDWGGMATNGWYQIGGKWYYFNSWGGMVKNSWIYGLDKKWYYVGSDGAMLVNTKTPDGYWVNGSGVWVR